MKFSILCTAFAAILLAACGSDDGTRTIARGEFGGGVACYPDVNVWYESLTVRDQHLDPKDDPQNDPGTPMYSLQPGDRVQEIDHHMVDEQPGLVSDTGEVVRVRILNAPMLVDGVGHTCWLFNRQFE